MRSVSRSRWRRSIWATREQKKRLQRSLFPEGLRLRDGTFGTAATCMAFARLQGIEAGESVVASPVCASWNQIAAWLKQIDGVRKAA